MCTHKHIQHVCTHIHAHMNIHVHAHTTHTCTHVCVIAHTHISTSHIHTQAHMYMETGWAPVSEVAEMHIKEMNSGSPEACIFPYREC